MKIFSTYLTTLFKYFISFIFFYFLFLPNNLSIFTLFILFSLFLFFFFSHILFIYFYFYDKKDVNLQIISAKNKKDEICIFLENPNVFHGSIFDEATENEMRH